MNPVIDAVHTALVSLNPDPALVVHGSRGSHDRSDFLFVRVTTSDGTQGYGEVSATPLWSGEDGWSAEHFIKTHLAPALVGRPLAPIGGHEVLMDRILGGNPFTKAGVSTALWDAFARNLGVPLVVALGGPYRAQIPIKLSLSGDHSAIERGYAAAIRAGFCSFKIKVGLGVSEDLARFSHARELAGDSTMLGVDANGGWSRTEAARAVDELTRLGACFVEQPLAASDLTGHYDLRNRGLPVVLDESVFDVEDLRRAVRADAADVISVYVGKSGGPGRAVQMGKVAEHFGIETLIGSNGELGIGAAAQLHVAAAVPALSAIPSDIIGAHYYTEDVLAVPLDSNGAQVRLGNAPGLGVSLRADIEQEFR